MGHAHVRGTGDRIEGAGVGIEGPVGKVRFGLEEGYERLATVGDPLQRKGVVGVDATLRFGLVSAVLAERCGEYCLPKPWLDVGPGAGVGVAATGDLDMVAHAFGGGWMDFRLGTGDSYWVLRLELQRDVYSSAVQGDTQLVIGLGAVEWNTQTSRDD